MRIVHLLTTFIAVLAAVVRPWCGAQYHNSSYSAHRSKTLPLNYNNNLDLAEKDSDAWRHGIMNAKKMQDTVRRESVMGKSSDCCPSVLEMIEPTGGKNQGGMYVDLYRDGENIQRFYEMSCEKDIENKPCRFIDRRLHNQSRCVQKYTYTYALVRDNGGEHTRHARHFPALPGSGVTMDYIRVRSGCSCEISPKEKRHKKLADKRRSHDPRTRPRNPNF